VIHPLPRVDRHEPTLALTALLGLAFVVAALLVVVR
jgi:hypothetical protein